MHRCGLLSLVILFLGIFVGCGDSDEFVEPVAAPNVGTIQVQVRSTRFTAQTTADPVYVVTVMNQQGQTITIEIFQQPPPTEVVAYLFTRCWIFSCCIHCAYVLYHRIGSARLTAL